MQLMPGLAQASTDASCNLALQAQLRAVLAPLYNVDPQDTLVFCGTNAQGFFFVNAVVQDPTGTALEPSTQEIEQALLGAAAGSPNSPLGILIGPVPPEAGLVAVIDNFAVPTQAPTRRPTPAPTDSPTAHPTEPPTRRPRPPPTPRPTPKPTPKPTPSPTDFPTLSPTQAPTPRPKPPPVPVPTNPPVATPTAPPPPLCEVSEGHNKGSVSSCEAYLALAVEALGNPKTLILMMGLRL
jgi:hypothetical protein